MNADRPSPSGVSGRPRYKWYGSFGSWKGPVGRVQIESQIRDVRNRGTALTLPEQVLRLAQAEYDRQHPGQPYERMQERGGLGILEIVALLADYIERIDPTASDE